MKKRLAVSLGLSALLLGGTLAGGAFAGGQSLSGDARKAIAEAGKARALIAQGKGAAAVGHAERAALAAPESADFRMLLGQSYLKAGRFASARDTFADTLALDAGNGKAALNLALMQIATGDWGAARKTLDAHAASISVSDRGLAVALAGDPSAAVDLLAAAARVDPAGVKTRQNLALSLALAGRWTEARQIAGLDLAPGDADKRILEWAAFARPKAASDQIATLLGVTAVRDKGRPAALALNATTASVSVANATPAAPAPAAVVPAPVDIATTAPAPAVPGATAVPSLDTGVQFAARQEVVQPLPASKALGRTAVARNAVAVADEASPAALASGRFYVQLGAYDSAGVARDAWKRAARTFPSFSGHEPQGASIKTAAGSFYRLSVGGYTRTDAVKLCLAYRASGGRCFVRANAGDQVASWIKPGQQLASR
ncbi:SPOR domain-containing protein [Sphingomonas sp. BAUL-RG-20F-R05-02]|uniref:SPOR domain-containing protein n=1 Tax=Sphingomonas sp. BAUL-RG-20F-R05-02 TaxID=2914830 RepID=UPI001F57D7CC|nr:SPOR domain-containing protein [Sphingomonas sp. BAUL-RG-20F-R05-02]